MPERFGFEVALQLLKGGARVARKGWNGKGMFIKAIKGGDYSVKVPVVEGVILPLLPWIGMKTADNSFVPWLASQTDILAEDWEIAQ